DQVMQSASADGGAKLVTTPLAATPQSERKTIRAPRFDATFYPDGKVQTYVATGGVEVLVEPMQAGTNRLSRKTTSDRAEANFDPTRGDLTRIVQTGNVAFEEGPRQATAERATFIRERNVIELRGETKRPAVWDDTARAEARELDLSTSAREHVARGDVRTTYYDARQAGSAGMFGQPSAPVFVTSREARAEPQRAMFTGDARCWQGDSFVRGDRLELFKSDRRLTATGNVSTAFYRVARSTASRPEANRSASVEGQSPVFGTAQTFTYSDVERRARYTEQVKLVQGDATLTADAVDVELAARENRLERMTATGSVVIVQPGRRAVGDLARYTAADDRYVVTGNLARVEDAERGVSTAPEVSFAKSDGIVRASGGGRPQRVRTTYQSKP
ncbi:MAG: LptA/OstA family protein, partial [Chloracidobacterium sp.]